MAINTEDYAVIVGVNGYANGIQPLNGCVNDANNFYKWLTDSGGGGLNPLNVARLPGPRPIEMCLVPNGTWATATSLQIRQFIAALELQAYPRNNRIGRRLYLWFAGHGTDIDNTSDCGFVTVDSAIGAVTVIPGQRVAAGFVESAVFDEVVLFMSCCRTVLNMSVSTQHTSNLTRRSDLAGVTRGLFGFAAAWAATTVELELPDPFNPNPNPNAQGTIQGVFSYAVLRGLLTAVDEDGNITSESVARYVRKVVPSLLKSNANLVPNIAPYSGVIVFRPAEDVNVDIAMPPGQNMFFIKCAVGMDLVPAVSAAAGPDLYRIKLRTGAYVFERPAPQGPAHSIFQTITHGGPNYVDLR